LEIRKKNTTHLLSDLSKINMVEIIFVILENEFQLVLPDRLSKLSKKYVQDLNLNNNNCLFIYNGMGILINGHKNI